MIENEKDTSIKDLVSAYKTPLTDIAEGIIEFTPLDTPYKAAKCGIEFAKKCYNILMSKGEISEKDIELLHKSASLVKSRVKVGTISGNKKSSQRDLAPNLSILSTVATRVVNSGGNYILKTISNVLSTTKKTWENVQQIKKGIDNAFDVHEIRQTQKTDKIAIQLIKQEGRKKLQRVAGKKQREMVKKIHASAIHSIDRHTKQSTENIKKKIRKRTK